MLRGNALKTAESIAPLGRGTSGLRLSEVPAYADLIGHDERGADHARTFKNVVCR